MRAGSAWKRRSSIKSTPFFIRTSRSSWRCRNCSDAIPRPNGFRQRAVAQIPARELRGRERVLLPGCARAMIPAYHRVIIGTLRCSNDVAVIDLLIHVMNGYACPLLVSCKRLFPCFQARKLRQERWMNVDDPARKAASICSFKHAHETGQNDNLALPHFCNIATSCASTLRLKPGPKMPRRQVGVRHPNSRAISRIGASSTSEITTVALGS